MNRLRGLLESERIERDRNLAMLDDACKKLEAQMKNSEIRSPIDGLLTAIKVIDGELVADRAELFTISSRKNYVRGEVDEEDVGEVKVEMEAVLQVYAFRTRQFGAKVSAIQPAADPETQRYTIVLDLENPPENLMAGMTGEMNIVTGRHENVLLLPSRALVVDQALIVKRGIVQTRTVKVGYRTLDFSEIVAGLSEGEKAVLSEQDKLRPGKLVRHRSRRSRREQTNRDAYTSHSAPIPEPSEACVHPESLRRRFRRGDLYLHAGADAGFRTIFH